MTQVHKRASEMKISTLYLAAAAVALLSTPAAAALFDSGDVFASTGDGRVQVYDDNGSLLTTLNTGQGGFTTGSVSDTSGNFYVTNFSVGSVSKFDNNGVSLGLADSGLGGGVESIIFNKTGTGYVGKTSGGISVLGGANIGLTARVDWFDLAANQTTFYYTQEGSTVERYDTVSGNLTSFATGLTGGNAFALRILADGSVLVADNADVAHLDALGNLISTYNVGTNGVFSLDVTPDGKNFWTGSFSNGNLYEVNIASGLVVQTINTNSGQLFGVSVAGEKTVGGGGGVPEPAAWAMMLIGLGGIGVMARRQNRAKVSASA